MQSQALHRARVREMGEFIIYQYHYAHIFTLKIINYELVKNEINSCEIPSQSIPTIPIPSPNPK